MTESTPYKTPTNGKWVDIKKRLPPTDKKVWILQYSPKVYYTYGQTLFVQPMKLNYLPANDPFKTIDSMVAWFETDEDIEIIDDYKPWTINVVPDFNELWKGNLSE